MRRREADVIDRELYVDPSCLELETAPCASGTCAIRRKTSDKLAPRYRHDRPVTSSRRASPVSCALYTRVREVDMRVSAEHNIETPAPAQAADPSAPDLSFLARDAAAALQSFYGTIDRIVADNPVGVPRLQELAAKAKQAPLTDAESRELQGLKLQALRQGRAIGAVIGFFLK